MALRCSAKVLSSASKHKKVVIYLKKKIHVLDKPHSGIDYNAIACM